MCKDLLHTTNDDDIDKCFNKLKPIHHINQSNKS